MAMVTKTIDNTDGQQKIFAKMGTKENLLIMSTCACGNKNKTSFYRTSLLDIIRDRIVRLCDGVDAIDGTPLSTADDYDPMSEIVSGNGAPSEGRAIVSTDAKGRTRYYRNRAKNCIVTLDLASRCKEVKPAMHTDATCEIVHYRPRFCVLVDRRGGVGYALLVRPESVERASVGCSQ